MNPENKLEKAMSPQEAAEFLRGLADSLESGHLDMGELELELDQSIKVKQSVKNKGGKVSFKLKLKYEKLTAPLAAGADQAPASLFSSQALEGAPAALEGEQVRERPSYKQLKKEMGKVFKLITKPLAEGALPGADTVAGFLAQCQLMTSYPGRGDEHYADFLAQAEALSVAVAAGQLEEARQAAAGLEAAKKSCHAQYK